MKVVHRVIGSNPGALEPTLEPWKVPLEPWRLPSEPRRHTIRPWGLSRIGKALYKSICFHPEVIEDGTGVIEDHPGVIEDHWSN